MSIGGVWGKILHVNLTDGRSWIEQLPDGVYLRLVGGRARAAYLLLRDLPAGADPLGPENLLIFAPGILQGTNLPGAGRHGVGAKSPRHVLWPARRPAAGGDTSSSGRGTTRWLSMVVRPSRFTCGSATAG